MKILISTNFSKLSHVAVHLAFKLAKKLDAEIVLLNGTIKSASPHKIFAAKVKAIDDGKVDNTNRIEMNLYYNLTSL